MSKFYISDTHFNHANIIKLCSRPFSSVGEMNETLIRNWNRKVKRGDEVYFLGDFCFGDESSRTRSEIMQFIKRLNGEIYFIKGNHDCNFGRGYDVDRVCEWVRHYSEIKDNGRKVILSHYPIEDWNGKFRGSYHLFGHIHNNDLEMNTRIPNRFNVGVEVNNYEPKTLDELIEKHSGSHGV